MSRNWLAFAAHVLTLVGVIIIFSLTNPPASLDLYRATVKGPNQTTDVTGAFNPKCNINFPIEVKNIASVNVYKAVLAFFVITAIAHFFQATDGLGTGLQTAMISQGWNWVRWIEYGLSASIMSFIVGAADGTRDLPTLVCLSLITIAIMLNGLSVEAVLRSNVSFNREVVIASTIAGWILVGALFWVILYNFLNLVVDVKNLYAGYPDANVPAWLYFIGPLQLFWYACFGFVQLAQVSDRLNGVVKAQANYEGWYIFLSFAAKISLAAGIAQGLAFRHLGCD